MGRKLLLVVVVMSLVLFGELFISVHSQSVPSTGAVIIVEQEAEEINDENPAQTSNTKAGSLNVIKKPSAGQLLTLEDKNMASGYSTIQKEKKRYNIDQEVEIPIDKMGFSSIPEDDMDNLYNKALRNEISIDKIQSKSYTKLSIWVSSQTEQKFTLKAGTLFYPEDSKAKTHQTLILLEDMSVEVTKGRGKQIDLSTSCFNAELQPPGREKYFLTNIVASKYKKGMDQNRVWDITAENKVLSEQYIKTINPSDL